MVIACFCNDVAVHSGSSERDDGVKRASSGNGCLRLVVFEEDIQYGFADANDTCHLIGLFALVSVQVLDNGFLYFCTTQAASENRAISIYEQNLGNALDAVCVRANLLCIDDLRIGDA